MKLVPVDDCLVISVTPIAKAERRRTTQTSSSEGGLQFANEVTRQLANKESYYEPKLGQVQCSTQGGLFGEASQLERM